MARITVEDCVDKFPSRFELVLVASQRARKLHSGEDPTVSKDNDKNTVIALREIAESTLSIQEMKENLIEEYQTVTIADEENENLELESYGQENNEISEDKDSEKKDDIISSEVDDEIKKLSTEEDSELKNQYEISDEISQNEENQNLENNYKDSDE